MNHHTDRAEEVARRLGGSKARRSGKGWKTCCPAHDDADPSLSISDGEDGRLLVTCHANCDRQRLLETLRARGINVGHAAGDHPHDDAGNIATLQRKGFVIVEAYPYRDENGTLLYENVRLERQNGRRVKTFRQRRLNGNGGWIESLGAVSRVPYRLPELMASGEQHVHCTEGEKDADRLARHGLVSTSIATPSNTNLTAFRKRIVYIHEDNDTPGRAKSARLAATLSNIAAEVRIVRYPDAGDGGDVSDWLDQGHDLEALLQRCDESEMAPPNAAVETADDGWAEPKPLPNGLAPVASFDLGFLPCSIAAWVGDIADRMQCPPDLVAIPAVVALGSIIGRNLGVRPQQQTTWLEVPNVWGSIVARPGAMKSPAMEEALKPLKQLEAQARKEHAAAQKAYEAELEAFKIEHGVARTRVRKDGAKANVLLELEEPEKPEARRYSTNDTSYEKLGEILAANGRGILVVRDELLALLRALDREENAGARGFYQTGWNGTSSYTFDRIMRGNTHIDGVCISVLGAVQPGALAEYVRHAVAGGTKDDGLLQRFSLMVWPDQGGEWRDVDRWPDSEARTKAWKVFGHLDGLVPEAVQAQHDEFEPVPFLRFDGAAHEIFLGWRTELEGRLRSELHPALVSHFAKYRKLVPALALINHLADYGVGEIGVTATQKALSLARYLETHARRIYGAGTEAETRAAAAILHRVRKGDLADGFTARDIYRAAWSNLSDRGEVQAGLDLLFDLDWISPKRAPTGPAGGRPKVQYLINPRGKA